MRGPIDDGTVDLLQRTLRRSAIGASVAAANLANVDTPGYRALEARFGESLAAAGRSLELGSGASEHIAAPGEADPVVFDQAPTDRMRSDGNTVDVDREMTRLASMHGRYDAAAQLVRKRFALLRYAVSDGRSGS